MGSEENKKYLIEKYKDKVISPEKSIYEVLRIFKERLDIVEIDLSEVNPTFRQFTKINFLHSLKNRPVGLWEQDIVLNAFRIIHNNKSKNYYEEMILEHKKDEEIIILVEKKIEAIASNSQRLQLELFIEQGISGYHYKNETPEFFGYLMYLDGLEKKNYL